MPAWRFVSRAHGTHPVRCGFVRLAPVLPQVMRLTLREVKVLKLLPPHANIVHLLEAFRSKSGRCGVCWLDCPAAANTGRT